MKKTDPNNQTIQLAFFGHNRKDAAIIRRAESFLDAGVDVTGFMFRRDGEPLTPGPAWKNVDLGMVEHCKHLQRIYTMLRALWQIFSHRALLRQMDIIYARNIDLILLAFMGLLFSRTRPKVVYECLDVHAAMTKTSITGKIIRWIERKVLARSDLLVVSSPGFIREYFTPVQNYQGPHALIENKLYFGSTPIQRPSPEDIGADQTESPLVISWIGILRCQQTLDLLKALAQAEGERVIIRFRGIISEFLIPDFNEQIAPFSNIIYDGPYKWPEGLADAYHGAHFVWSQELSWSGHNSDWLLPNRIYEGSYFGTLSLCVAGTETGRIVAERNLGYVLPDSQSKTFINFIRNIDRKELLSKQESLLNRPESDFVASTEETKRFITRILNT